MGKKVARLADLIDTQEPLKKNPTGAWKLLPNQEVGYRLEGRDEEIRIRGPILAAEPDALVAAVTVRQDDQTVVTRTVRIAGRWKTDGGNRIVFEVERSRGRTNTLVFRGTWKLNDAQEIVYTHRTAGAPGGRRASEQEIVFRGDWKLSEKRQISYVLGGDSGSAFRFRGAFQTPSILAKKGEIRFQLGAEVTGRGGRGDRAGRAERKTLTLFGTWKVGRDLGLSFELDRPGSRRSVLRFGGDFSLKGPRTLSVNLKSERGRPLGVELVLTREILGGDGALFARIARTAEETRVEAGGKINW